MKLIEIIISALTALFPFIAWGFADYIPDISLYQINLKPVLVIMFFIISLILFLILFIIKLNNKVSTLNAKIKSFEKLKKVDGYDILEDAKGNKFCPIHKIIVTHTGPWGRDENSYYCTECKQWFEKEGTSPSLPFSV